MGLYSIKWSHIYHTSKNISEKAEDSNALIFTVLLYFYYVCDRLKSLMDSSKPHSQTPEIALTSVREI